MKKPILIAILLIVCANVGAFLGYFFTVKPGRVDVDSPFDRRVACGAFCLRIAANLYGIPSDEAHALSRCPPEADGTRLTSLEKAAPKFGMKASVAHLTWEKLLTMTEFAILHVNDNHYVLANPNERNGDAIRIYDHDLGARWYDQQSLEAIWQGTSLILARDPNFKFPSLISTPTYWIDKGDFTEDNEVEYSFTIRNIETKPIVLKTGPTSCGCASAKLEQETLEPGEETKLSAIVKLKDKRGGFRENVALFSECGEERRVVLFILAGTVIRQDILSAERMFVGTTHRGGTINETFAIHDPGNGQLKSVEATLQEPVSWLDAKFTCEKITDANRHSTRKLNVRPGDWLVTLSAEIKKDAALHNFKLPISVPTNLPAPLDVLTVSLEGAIVPAISVEPAALIFSDQSSGLPKTLYAKSLVPSLWLPDPLVRIGDNAPLLYKTERVNDQDFSFEIRLNANDGVPPNTFTADISLDFGEEGAINVPVIYQTGIESSTR
jgi:hypothetical protein